MTHADRFQNALGPIQGFAGEIVVVEAADDPQCVVVSTWFTEDDADVEPEDLDVQIAEMVEAVGFTFTGDAGGVGGPFESEGRRFEGGYYARYRGPSNIADWLAGLHTEDEDDEGWNGLDDQTELPLEAREALVVETGSYVSQTHDFSEDFARDAEGRWWVYTSDPIGWYLTIAEERPTLEAAEAEWVKIAHKGPHTIEVDDHGEFEADGRWWRVERERPATDWWTLTRITGPRGQDTEVYSCRTWAEIEEMFAT